jgi:hypothetical protein
VQQVIQRNIIDFRQVLKESPEGTLNRYAKLETSKPSWRRERIVKSLIAKPANRVARLGGAAGGVAFLPGIGTGLSVAAVAASTLRVLEASVEAIDVIARSHEIDFRDDARREGARLCVLNLTTPQRARISLSPPLPADAGVMMRVGSDDLEFILGATDDVVYRWAASVASWRLSAAAPFGIGAFMGAWTSYAPIRLATKSAEAFFSGIGGLRLDVEELTLRDDSQYEG